jgi:hypothetical protein
MISEPAEEEAVVEKVVAAEAVDFTTWTVVKLKAELSARGAATDGRKAELVARFSKIVSRMCPMTPIPEQSEVMLDACLKRRALEELAKDVPKNNKSRRTKYTTQ